MGITFKGKEVIAVNLVKWLTLFEAKSRKLKREVGCGFKTEVRGEEVQKILE